MAKKKKSEINKSRTRADDKKKKKRKLQHLKAHQKPRIIHRPGLPHMGAPEGFRSISMAQAIMEYAEPLMKYCEQDQDAFQTVTQISMVLWNYSNDLERGAEDKKIKKDIIRNMQTTFGLDENNADNLLAKMVERYNYLFPQDVQPAPGTPFMFIRKEVRYLIKPFDYEKLVISDDIIPPDEDEKNIVERVEKLDRYIYEEADYGTYEEFFFSTQDELRRLFEKWLVAKGLKDYAEEFSFCPDTYLNFIYAYMHDDAIVLKSIPNIYFVEFFEDYLLRKMMAKPHEYVSWPPALKLFYWFLHEKGYLDNHEKIINQISQVEPYFIEVLKKQFS